MAAPKKIVIPLYCIPRQVTTSCGSYVPRILRDFLTFDNNYEILSRYQRIITRAHKGLYKPGVSKKCSRGIRRSNITWNAFITATFLAFPKTFTGLRLGRRKNRRALQGMRRLFMWIVCVGTQGSEEELIREIKTFCDYFEMYSANPIKPDLPDPGRSPFFPKGKFSMSLIFRGTLTIKLGHEILDNKKRLYDNMGKLFTLYSLKGAIGGPTKKIKEKGLRKLHHLGTNPVPVRKELTELAYLYGREWALSFPFKRKYGRPHLTIGHGAAIGAPRSSGGRSTFLLKAVRTYRSLLWDAIDEPPPYFDIFGRKIFRTSCPDDLLYSYRFTGDEVVAGCDRDVLEDREELTGILEKRRGRKVIRATGPDFSYAAEMMCWAKGHSDGYILIEDDQKVEPEGPKLISSLEGWEGVGNDSPFLRFYSEPPDLTFKWSDKEMPFEVEPVDDSGAKARWISKSPCWYTSIQHILRTVVQNKMNSDSDCHVFASGGGWEGFYRKVSLLTPKPDHVWINLDLTSATDTFSREICQSLLRGAGFVKDTDGMEDINVKCELISQSLLSPFRMMASQSCQNELDNIPDPWLLERGQLMGTPSSWVGLNLYLKFFTSIATIMSRHRVSLDQILDLPKEAGIQSRVLRDCREFKPWVHRCGDDQLCYNTPEFRENFLKVLAIGGAIPSSGTNSMSRNIGHFCKSMMFFKSGPNRHGKRKLKLIWTDGWQTKAKVFGMKPSQTRLQDGRDQNGSLTLGTAITSQMRYVVAGDARRPGLLRTSIRLAIYNNHRLVQRFKDSGLSPYAPSFLCGAELPHEGSPLAGCPKDILGLVAWILADDNSVEKYVKRYEIAGLFRTTREKGRRVRAEKALFPYLRPESRIPEESLRILTGDPATDQPNLGTFGEDINVPPSMLQEMLDPVDFMATGGHQEHKLSVPRFWCRKEDLEFRLGKMDLNDPKNLKRWKTFCEVDFGLVKLRSVLNMIELKVRSTVCWTDKTEYRLVYPNLGSISRTLKRKSRMIKDPFYFLPSVQKKWRERSMEDLYTRREALDSGILIHKSVIPFLDYFICEQLGSEIPTSQIRALFIEGK